jgi:hypothetical protein
MADCAPKVRQNHSDNTSSKEQRMLDADGDAVSLRLEYSIAAPAPERRQRRRRQLEEKLHLILKKPMLFLQVFP